LKDFQENHHVLIVSHDFSLIRKICRHFWILQHGSLIFSGDLEELNAQHAVKEQVGIYSFEKIYRFSDI
jgi:ABC-type polysaccharide/polyol phosphate transport system ATPase subunit